jgi:quercetin dioxygenase-like cupin family protein
MRGIQQEEIVGPGQGQEFNLGGAHILMKVGSDQTEGRFAFVQARNAPGWESELNRHPEQSKVFFVLNGSYEFLAGDQWRKVGPGDTVLVPAGTVHGFRAGPDGGRVLIVYPGRSSGWFADVAAVGGLSQLGDAEHAELHARHHVESLGPLPMP